MNYRAFRRRHRKEQLSSNDPQSTRALAKLWVQGVSSTSFYNVKLAGPELIHSRPRNINKTARREQRHVHSPRNRIGECLLCVRLDSTPLVVLLLAELGGLSLGLSLRALLVVHPLAPSPNPIAAAIRL